MGLAFGLWIASGQGRSAAVEYYAADFVEESLSIDNIFVFVIVFSELHNPAEYQHRVLGYGIAGALVFRALMHFQWIIYVFAALMLFPKG
ncbi:MAG: integral rane protein TerC [Acidobacteriaceae bacterium]|nr:integral rane protein TerC [Acidobacteriaceae bacterium]